MKKNGKQVLRYRPMTLNLDDFISKNKKKKTRNKKK